MWPFRRKPLLDSDTARWHLDNFAWLVRNHGQHSRFADAQLVLPSKDFFETDDQKGHAMALRLFGQVKAYCGLGESDIALVQTDSPPSQAGGLVINHGKHAAGTYSWGWGRQEAPQISYGAKLLDNPQSFIATMAHELAHHLLAKSAAETPPVDADEDEHLTDITAVYLGFGVFLANSAFNMQTHADGWSYSRQGYLPESDLVFALAIFLKVKQISPGPAFAYLKADLGAMLRRALRDLDAHASEIAAMRLSDPGLRKQTGQHVTVVT
ncbi:hypothetical protein LMIY3S_00989 [Labrys miyagiensis]